MRNILRLLKDFILNQNAWCIALCILWASIMVYLNYAEGWHLQWVRESRGLSSYFFHALIYAIAYWVPLFISLAVNATFGALKSKWLWFIGLSSPFVFAFTSHYDVLDIANLIDVIPEGLNWYNLYTKSSFWLSQVGVVVIFTYTIWLFKDRREFQFYGIGNYAKSMKPYFIMLLIMLIPILIFGNTEGFQAQYPRIKSIIKENSVQVGWVEKVFFELAYGINFIGIELFFRGFLIISLINILGKDAIFPMACFYVAIHFGKPMGECISSFFGGTLLGVISYHHKSIFGGVLVHVGIAWMMEIAGALGKWVW